MTLTLPQLASHAGRMLEQHPRQQALAYAWPYPWAGGDTIQIEGRALPVHYCQSSLELRQILAEECSTPRIFLVNVPDSQLGQDVLARLVRRELLHVDRWQLVQDAYDVRQIDPRLYELRWLPPMLLDALPETRTSAAPVLTHAEAMATCLAHLWGLPIEQPGVEDLALTCERSGARWLALDEEPRQHFRPYLVEQFGSLAAAFISTMENGTAHALVATGLACEVLFSADAEHIQEVRDARIRLESRLGGHRLTVAEGRQWADIALGILSRRDDAVRVADQRLATDLLMDMGVKEHLAHSSALPAGLDARLATLAEAIKRFLQSMDRLAEVEAAFLQVLAHRFPPEGHPGPEAARMAVRLCRSLAGAPADSGADQVAGYIQHGAWQDWARRALRGVRPQSFASAVSALLDTVGELRQSADHAFATALANKLQLGEVPAGLIPIEAVLEQVVAPLARHNLVLMVVLDGMSMDVAHAIDGSLASRGWRSWSREGAAMATLATVPSVTECSRASLLAGRLVKGVARQEARWFADHADLLRVSRENRPARLFHKAGVEQGQQLSMEVSDAIGDAEQQVVGVVINAIDDSLDKTDQLRIDWDMETIPLLAELLDCARHAGRVVILTSDHGHVLERGSTLVHGGDGERYRLSDAPTQDGEITISGPRVQALMGADVIVPWRENIRYAVKKNGYHGGVSRQEMIVPLSIWSAGDAPLPEGQHELVHTFKPEWWDGVAAVDVEHSLRHVVGMPSRKARKSDMPVDDLFSRQPQDDLVERLLSSPVLGHQSARIGRIALEPQRLASLVGRLEDGGGRASLEQLARASGLPVMRMRGVVSVLERTLNVDGFPVITFEQGTGTVLLDRQLLSTQFQL